MTPASDGIEVGSVVCHAHVAMAVRCLGSLVAMSAEPLRLRLHDDGSLTAEDRATLAEGIQGVRVITRAEADDLVAGVLARHPALAAYRRANPLGLKLVDVIELSDGATIAYCDTDVLFLRPFSGLFSGLEKGWQAVFMADRQNAYSVRSYHVATRRRLRLAARVNSGIVHVERTAVDYELIEWYLSRRSWHFAPVWVEQTAWALLGARVRSAHIAEDQVAVASSDAVRGDRVGLHFVSPVRHLFSGSLPSGAGRSPEPIRFRPTGRCGAVGLGLDELRRRLGRTGLLRRPVVRGA